MDTPEPKLGFVDRTIREKYPKGRKLSKKQKASDVKPDERGLRPIGGYYVCYHCAVADIFGGEISEEE